VHTQHNAKITVKKIFTSDSATLTVIAISPKTPIHDYFSAISRQLIIF